MDWLDITLSILEAAIVVIPLVVALVKYVRKAYQEKNWSKMMNLLVQLMEEAEAKFVDGATKKDYVMALIKASAESINYDVDMDLISEMIDNLCDMSKVVNPPEKMADTK